MSSAREYVVFYGTKSDTPDGDQVREYFKNLTVDIPIYPTIHGVIPEVEPMRFTDLGHAIKNWVALIGENVQDEFAYDQVYAIETLDGVALMADELARDGLGGRSARMESCAIVLMEREGERTNESGWQFVIGVAP